MSGPTGVGVEGLVASAQSCVSVCGWSSSLPIATVYLVGRVASGYSGILPSASSSS